VQAGSLRSSAGNPGKGQRAVGHRQQVAGVGIGVWKKPGVPAVAQAAVHPQPYHLSSGVDARASTGLRLVRLDPINHSIVSTRRLCGLAVDGRHGDAGIVLGWSLGEGFRILRLVEIVHLPRTPACRAPSNQGDQGRCGSGWTLRFARLAMLRTM